MGFLFIIKESTMNNTDAAQSESTLLICVSTTPQLRQHKARVDANFVANNRMQM